METHPLYLDTLERLKTRSDGSATARCPLCADEGADRSGGNLSISAEGLVHCHRYPDHGYPVKQMLQADGHKPYPRRRTPSRIIRTKPKPRPKATREQILRGVRYCQTLAGDADLQERLAASRPEWGNAEVFRNLALDMDLGWTGREVAFVYENGAKLRGKCDGERTFRWDYGGNGELWRAAGLISDPRRVWITEGESDAITLITRGFDADGSLVLAIPCASGKWNPAWSPLLQGRDVVLVGDRDKAGERTTAAAIEDLRRFATVSTFNWQEVAA